MEVTTVTPETNRWSVTNIYRHKLFKDSFVYASSNVVRNGIPFFLLPVLTRYLSPTDYGIVATFEIVLAIAVVFVNLNMHGAVAVNYFHISKHELEVYIGNVVLIFLGCFILTFSIAYIFKTPFANYLKLPEGWLLILVAVASAQSVFDLALTLWQSEQKPLPYGLFQIFQSVLNVVLSLIFVIALLWGWEGRLIGISVATLLCGFVALWILYGRGYTKWSFNRVYMKDALLFGIGLIPHSLGGWIMTSIDRLFITSMVSVAATGMYAVGYQVGMIISLAATSFNQAWAPFLFEKLKANDSVTKHKIVNLTYLYILAIVVLALALSAVAPWFLEFFVSKEFQGADKFVFWVALGYAANGMYFMVVNYIVYVKRTHILAWITLLTAVLAVILDYVLIKANGAIGAAQATTIIFGVRFLVTWIASATVYEMPWRVWKYVRSD